MTQREQQVLALAKAIMPARFIENVSDEVNDSASFSVSFQVL